MCFNKRHRHFICSNSPVELAPHKEKEEQYLNSVGVYATKRRLHHRDLGAVLSLTGDMASVCAFFLLRG